MFVNATKRYQFKAKDSEIRDYELCLVNISKDFTIIFNFFFSVDFNPTDNNDALDIHKYLMKIT